MVPRYSPSAKTMRYVRQAGLPFAPETGNCATKGASKAPTKR